MVTVVAAFSGLGRALASPKLLLWLWLANLLAALPAAVLIGDSIHDSIGASRVDEALREGFDLIWWSEYREQAQGLERTFEPSHSGPGAFFANLDAWFSGSLFELPPAAVAMGVGWALLWVLLLGGVLEQYVRPSPAVALERFLGAGGRYFLRFVRLLLVAAPLYYGVYRLAGVLFPWVERASREVTEEKVVLVRYLGAAALVVGLLVLVRMIFDFAKISIVSQERRSALLAALEGLGFVLRHPIRTFGLAAIFGLLGAAGLAVFSLVAPGAGQTDWTALAGALLLGQLALIGRLLLRCAWLAGEVALYEKPGRETLPRPL